MLPAVRRSIVIPNRAMPTKKRLAHGKIVWEKEEATFSKATVYIRLEDVSNVDGPAVTVAKKTIPGVSSGIGSTVGLDFEIYGETKHVGNAECALRVLVDIDGDNAVSRGDLVNMQSYRLSSLGQSDPIIVHVRSVK